MITMVENQVNCFSWCYVEVYTSHSSTVQCMFDAFNTFTDKRERTKDSDSLSLPKASEMSVLGKSGLSNKHQIGRTTMLKGPVCWN